MATGSNSKNGGTPHFASLYVGDLNTDVTEAMLYEIFNAVGPVGSIRVCRDSLTRKSMGYGYVNFHGVADAERALDTLNYTSIKGRACRIMWSQRDPTARKAGTGNIVVKNLDDSIDNKALYDTFSLFGKILSVKVAADAGGKSWGYGFVHYETDEAAAQAIDRVHGMQIGGKTVEVYAWKKKKGDNEIYTNLYFKNFNQDWDEERVKELFTPFGEVTAIAFMKDKLGRKFGFINFEKPEDAKNAVEGLNGRDLRTQAEKDEAILTMGVDGEQKDGDDSEHLFFCSRALTKAERAKEFQDKGAATPSGRTEQGGVNLYVKNLDPSVDDASLKELFSSFGNVTSVSAMKDEAGKCKGFGFVCFGSPVEATKAVTEMHLKVVMGKPLYVGLAEKREARQERLRQRYNGFGGKDGFGGKLGGKGGKGCGKLGGMMGGGCGANGPAGGPMMGGGAMMGPMGAKGMMPNPMALMGKGAMMGKGAAMMGKGGPMMGKGGPMMGAPMVAMVGKGGPMPGAMMQMMAKGGMGMMGPMGMMRPMMPMPTGAGQTQAQQVQQQPQQQSQQQPPAGSFVQGPLTATALAAAHPSVQKQLLGERLYAQIARIQPQHAGKVTGMMLEMDNSELLMLLESESQLMGKIDEALRMLERSS